MKLVIGKIDMSQYFNVDDAAIHSSINTNNPHHTIAVPDEITVNSGDTYFGKKLAPAINNKQVPEARTTDMAMRIVAS